MKSIVRILFFCVIVCPLFAQQTIGLFLNTPESLNGYTLFSNNQITYLIDNCGFQINSWQSADKPGLTTYLLENGHLLRTARKVGDFSGGGIGGKFELFNWEGDLLWSYELANSTIHAHHDIAPLPNGNFLAIVWEKFSESEAQQIGRVTTGELWSEKIMEIQPVGNDEANIVWEWRLWDHLVQDADSSQPNFGMPSNHPELVNINYIGPNTNPSSDWIHLNAIHYNAELDQIALSSRNFSEIWLIDHSTSTAEAAGHSGGNRGSGGDLLYRFGNPNAYDNGTSNDQVFFKQHDVRWVPETYPNAGKMMVFNNEKTNFESSVIMWTPSLKMDGTYEINNGTYGPTTIDWEYTAPGFYSRNMSGAQPLPNGNVLVCEAREGRFFEINLDGEILWEYINPVNTNGGPSAQGASTMMLTNDTFRATRYATSYAAFDGKDLTPQVPVEINPWESDCVIYEESVAVKEVDLNAGIRILGNLTQDVLQVESDFVETKKIILYDMMGRVVIQFDLQKGINKFNVSSLLSGFYVLSVNGGRGERYSQKLMKY